jgi:hypothetical protein
LLIVGREFPLAPNRIQQRNKKRILSLGVPLAYYGKQGRRWILKMFKKGFLFCRLAREHMHSHLPSVLFLGLFSF